MRIILNTGERIRLGRQRDNLSQAEFARRAAVSQSLVSRWETNETPPPPTIAQQYAALGMLKPHERAAVMRRRMGISVKGMAHLFRVSRFQIIKLESGRADIEKYLQFVVDLYRREQ